MTNFFSRVAIVFLTAFLISAQGCGKSNENKFGQENTPNVPKAKPEPHPEGKRAWKALPTEPKPYDILDYALDVNFEKMSISKPEFKATLDITLIPSAEGQQLLSLDSKNLQIDHVWLKNEVRELSFKTSEKNLEVDLGRVYHSPESITLSIQYTWAKPFNQGLYMTSRNENLEEPETVWTTSEPDDMSYWMPGNVQSNDKASFSAKVRAPLAYTIISNGELISEKKDRTHRTVQWAQKEPMSSYLYVLTLGKFSSVKTKWKDVSVEYYSVKDKIKNVAQSLKKTPQALEFLSNLLDYKYPYKKYAQLVVSRFSWGGMEHVTATTLWDGPTRDEKFAEGQSQDPLMSHELAHQWFGDLLTCENWSHLWLNESFATFLDWEFENFASGKESFDRLLASGFNWYLAEEKQESKPIVYPFYHVAPEEFFDSRAYPKGGMVLRHLKYTMGEKAFFKGLNHYLNKHAYQVVNTDDLRKALEESSGQDLTAFFKQWIYQTSHPMFETSWKYESGSKMLTLKIEQKNPDKTLAWFGRMPLEIDGKTVHIQVAASRSQEIIISLDKKPSYVRFNSEQTWIETHTLDQSLDSWIAQLGSSKDSWGRVEASQVLVAMKATSPAESAMIHKAILTCASSDSSWWVQSYCMSGLGELASQPEMSTETKSIVLDSLTKAMKNKNYSVRESAIASIVKIQGADVISSIDKLLETENSLRVRGKALAALGEIKNNESVKKWVINEFNTRDSFYEWNRAAAMDALNEMGVVDIDIAMKAYFLGQSNLENNEWAQSSALTMMKAVYKTQPQHQERAIDVFKMALVNPSISVRVTMVGLLRDVKETKLIETMKFAAANDISTENRLNLTEQLTALVGHNAE